MNDDPDPRPAPTLKGDCLRLLRIALTVVLAGVVPLYLPTASLLAYWLAMNLVQTLEQRLRGSIKITEGWVLGASLCLSWRAYVWLPFGYVLSIAFGVFCLFALLVLSFYWEDYSSPGERKSPLKIPLSDDDLDGLGHDPFDCKKGKIRPTPEGGTLRVIDESEIRMGPALNTYLLPDGSVIFNGTDRTSFSPDGRYFVTGYLFHSEWPLRILDRHQSLFYLCDAHDLFDRIDRIGNTTITGSEPRKPDKKFMVAIDDLISFGKKYPMKEIGNLKVPEDCWNQFRSVENKPFPAAPDGQGFLVGWRFYLPEDLMALDDPLDPLYQPLGEIIVHGKPSGILTFMENPKVLWRGDSRAFACLARRFNDEQFSWWYCDQELGWRNIKIQYDMSQDRACKDFEISQKIDTFYMYLEWQLRAIYSDYQEGVRKFFWPDLEQSRARAFKAPVVRQCLPVGHESGNIERVESAPLRNGKKLNWYFQRTDPAISCHVYRCELDGQFLDGEWLLDHRISPDRRCIALVAYAPPPQVPDRVAVLDGDTGQLCDAHESFYVPPP